MTDFERDVIDRLGRIETKLDADFRTLHGNGHPGLLDRVDELEKEMSALNSRKVWIKEWLGWIFALANLIVLYLKASSCLFGAS